MSCTDVVEIYIARNGAYLTHTIATAITTTNRRMTTTGAMRAG